MHLLKYFHISYGAIISKLDNSHLFPMQVQHFHIYQSYLLVKYNGQWSLHNKKPTNFLCVTQNHIQIDLPIRI